MSEKVTPQRDEVTMAGVDLDALERHVDSIAGSVERHKLKAAFAELRAARAVVRTAGKFQNEFGSDAYEQDAGLAKLRAALAEYDRLSKP